MTPRKPPTGDVAMGRRRLLTAAGWLGFATLSACTRKGSGASADGPSAPLLPPEALRARLAEVKGGKIAVLQVGPELLFHQSHVPGARWVGEAGTDEGAARLEALLKSIPEETEIVAYCGCCPISHCPNIEPARRILAKRSRTSYLDLPTNFRTDWIDKGLPVERG